MIRAFIVVDLGFGDAGKGLLTDHLVRTHEAKLVVRFNGGAQAGHNIVTPDGRHHTFSQLGAATFVPGVRTFLSRHVVVHPTALLVEADVLRESGVADALDRVFVSEEARLITPYHQAANRLRELARGAARHGSCGVGFGETVEDSLLYPDETLRAKDLRDRSLTRQKLERVRERKRQTIPLADHPEAAVFDDATSIDRWIERAAPIVGSVVPDERLRGLASESGAVVFEGAQGVLIDESFGFHPHTTWSDCTPGNALALIAEHLPDARTEVTGVLRTYMVRHGAGPLPTETDALAIVEHNREHAWQGRVRYGWFDAVLARYALAACGGVDTLAITHADFLARLSSWRACPAWSVDDAELSDLPISNDRTSLSHQEKLTAIAERARPLLETCSPASALDAIEALLERRIDLVSHGPRATDVRHR